MTSTIGESTTPIVLLRAHNEAHSEEATHDVVADEAPLEVQVQEHGAPARSVAVVMRSRIGDDDGDCGEHDLDLAIGFLFTEGVIATIDDVERVAHCDIAPTPEAEGNVVIVRVREGVRVDWARLTRHTYAASSCGVCGKASIDAVMTTRATRCGVSLSLSLSQVQAMCASLRARQRLFAVTGAVHGAALCTVSGDVLVVREDVGRHCAVDKVIGAALRGGVVTDGTVLVVSGRVAFEIVQKAASAGVAAIVAVGAPTSLAVALAKEAGIALYGFVKAERANRY